MNKIQYIEDQDIHSLKLDSNHVLSSWKDKDEAMGHAIIHNHNGLIAFFNTPDEAILAHFKNDKLLTNDQFKKYKKLSRHKNL